jgi:magnesium-transporting ATPase (P-type)
MAGQASRDPAWHALAVDAALARLRSTQHGLAAEEAARRLAESGPNRLPAATRRHPLARFALHFHNVLIYVLLGAAAITASLGHWLDTGVILAVVMANAVIGFVQEGRAEQAMDAIRDMLAPRANVLRGGLRVGIPGEQLVPGDVVLLEAGDKVPADLRLLQAHGLQLQEAILTGESVPVEKRTGAVGESAALGDRFCMAYSGTLVTTGQAHGVVVTTGARTEIGRISGLLSGVSTLETPLVAQMARFSRWLTAVILGAAAALLAVGFFSGRYGFAEMFMVVVGLSVAAIPEGLPAVLSVTLAIGVQSMARRNAIVRRMPAIETVGSVSVICTDKTGTLTRNQMVVVQVVTTAGRFEADGIGYRPEGGIRLGGELASPEASASLAEVGRAAALCNDAALREHEGQWSVEGDPMEGALLALAGKIERAAGIGAARPPRIAVVPFDARHRYMATLHAAPEGQAVVYLKGAPERVLAMCGSQRRADGGSEPLDPDFWHAQGEAIASAGQRVLALAMRPLAAGKSELTHEDVGSGLVLLGLVGMVDPPRPEAIEAVAACKAAGIRVKMVTGDHAGTATAIARQIGLANPDRVLTGADLDRLDDEALVDAAKATDVFARTSPEHKLRLVMALQAAGMSVAMTGDGVNDAPALKRADAGIAMGLKGSEAAKEAADLVLADDNFASIVSAVREGRTVYDNIRKVISWTLPTNAGEAVTIMVALMFGMTLPVTPIQILWINLITAVTLGMALAFEPTEENTMRRPPRPRNQTLLGAELVWHILLVSLLFVAGVYTMFSHALAQGHSLALAQTISVNTLVVMEIFHLFFIRNIHGTSLTWKAVRGTRVVWLTVGVITLAQFAVTYLPPLQQLLGTEAVPLADGVLIVLVGVALLAIIETEKQIRLRWIARRSRA